MERQGRRAAAPQRQQLAHVLPQLHGRDEGLHLRAALGWRHCLRPGQPALQEGGPRQLGCHGGREHGPGKSSLGLGPPILTWLCSAAAAQSA